MLKKHYFLLFLLAFCYSYISFGQDLIKDTRNNIQSNNLNVNPSKIADLVNEELSLIESSTPFDLFTVGNGESINNIELSQEVSDVVLLSLDRDQLSILMEEQYSHLSLKIPVTEKNHFELYLKQVDITNGAFILNTPEGKNLLGSVPNATFYRGYVKGNPDSWVALSVFEGDVRGIISDDNGDYVIGKLNSSEAFVLYNDNDLLVANSFECGQDESLEIPAAPGQSEITLPNTDTEALTIGECLDVYIEVDYFTYNNRFSGNLTNTTQWATDVFNEAATLYANDGFEIRLSEVFVQTTNSDPSAGLNSTLSILFNFGQRMQMNGFNGDFAHWISTRGLGGGVAWTNVMCREGTQLDQDGNTQYWGPYAVSAGMSTNVVSVPTYSWNVEVFAHEMGHNWSNPHTHNCGWGTVANPRPNSGGDALDCCGHNAGYPERNCSGCTAGEPTANGGTIMSYCHLTGTGINFNNGFHPVVKAWMNIQYANASCSDPCPTNATCDANAVTVTGTPNNEVGSEVSITTSGMVTVSGATEFKAPVITLTDGFTAPPNNMFTAIAEDCSMGASSVEGGYATHVSNIPTASLRTTANPFKEPLRISPNPSTGLVNIDYELEENSKVRLLIFDVSGHLVSTLLDGQTQEKGMHNVSYLHNELSGGLFYVIIETNREIHARKMIILE